MDEMVSLCYNYPMPPTKPATDVDDIQEIKTASEALLQRNATDPQLDALVQEFRTGINNVLSNEYISQTMTDLETIGLDGTDTFISVKSGLKPDKFLTLLADIEKLKLGVSPEIANQINAVAKTFTSRFKKLLAERPAVTGTDTTTTSRADTDSTTQNQDHPHTVDANADRYKGFLGKLRWLDDGAVIRNREANKWIGWLNFNNSQFLGWRAWRYVTSWFAPPKDDHGHGDDHDDHDDHSDDPTAH